MVLPFSNSSRFGQSRPFGADLPTCPTVGALAGWSAPELVEAGFSRQRLLLGVVLTVVVVPVLGRAAVVPGTVQPVHVDPMSPAEGDQLDPPT